MLNTAFNQRLDQLDRRYKRRLRTPRHQALLVAAIILMILMILMIVLEACTQSPDGHRQRLRDSGEDSHHVDDTKEVPEGLPSNHVHPTNQEVQS